MIIKARATKTAKTINWSAFKNGEIIDQSRWSLTLTTVIPDVIEDIFQKSRELDENYQIETIIPNGFTTCGLDFSITGKQFQLLCSRRLVRGLFPLNPIAAEFGGNYDVIVTIQAEDEIKKKFEKVLNKYKTN